MFQPDFSKIGNYHAAYSRIYLAKPRVHIRRSFWESNMTTANTSIGNNIFLVDDDSATVDLYRARLEHAGFKTASSLDAGQACESLANLAADLIIVDLMLPRRGGFDLLKAIRSDSRHKDTPILVLSNTYLPEMSQRALRAGGNKALPRV